jgi:group I intron endonuclease
MNIGIYTIKNKVNGKVYVGQSISLRKRKHDHFRALRTNTHYNTHLQSSWNKYGEDNFTFEVVESYSE